ncbi:MAG: nucleotidyltransferase family protein [Pseudomonadota bacterium]
MSPDCRTPLCGVILAAGLGTRMRPLTNDLPKPLVSLAGKPLLDHLLDRVTAADVPQAVLKVHYRAAQIETHLHARLKPTIIISDERAQLLDTGGGVRQALARAEAEIGLALRDGPILIHNSDSVWAEQSVSNLQRLFTVWDDAKMDALLLLAPLSRCLGYDGHGDFVMAQDGRLQRRDAQSPTPFAFIGVSLAHPRLLSGLPEGAFSLNLAWDRSLAQGRVFGLCLEGTWMHVGTPAALHDAEAFLRNTSGEPV